MDRIRRRCRGARSARVLLAAVLTLVLTGCVRFDVQVAVSPDGTVSGSVLLAVDRGVLELSGSPRSPIGYLAEDGTFPANLDNVQVFPYQRDGYVGEEYRFRDIPLAAFTASADDGSDQAFRIDRDGGVFRVTGRMDVSDEADEAGRGVTGFDPAALASSAQLRIRLTFPGEVLEANGEVDGTTVTWDLEVGARNELTAVAAAQPRLEPAALLPWTVLALVALAVLVVGVLLLREPEVVRPDRPIEAPPPAAPIPTREERAGGAAGDAARREPPPPPPPAAT